MLNTIILSIKCLALSAVVLVAALAFPGPRAVEKVPYIATRVGTKWVYARPAKETYVLTEVTRKGDELLVTLSCDEDGKLIPGGKFRVTDKGLFWEETSAVKIRPPICLLKLPAKAGEKWETEGRILIGEMSLDCRTGEEEEIKVPAGRFRAVPVVSKWYPSIAGSNVEPTDMTTWYARGVGKVKMIAKSKGSDIVEELESFTPGKE